jgi:hypothetical protein
MEVAMNVAVRLTMLAGLFAGSPCAAAEFALEVAPIKASLQISLPVPDRMDLKPGRYIAGDSGATAIPVQVIAVESASGAKEKRLVTVIGSALDGKTRRLVLKADSAEAKPVFSMKSISDKSLELCEGEHRVWVYNHGVMSREGVKPSYNRSDYFHPVYGPQGEVLTDDFPKDHYHHRGLFWAWTTVQVAGAEGQKFESWIPNNFSYVFERWLCREAGSVGAVLGAEVSWQTGERKTVREEWVTTVYPETADGRVMDFEIVWTALKDAVTVKGEPKKGYGGFSIRFAPRKDEVITTPDGKSPKDLEAGKIACADYSGLFEGAKEPSGAAIFVHPNHPGSPLTWLTRYYGFLCPEYPGLGAMTLEPNKPVRVAYRVWIHKGVPDGPALHAQHEAYQQGLAVKLVMEP